MRTERHVTPAPRRATVVPLAIVALVVAAGTGLILSVRTSYPDQIAHHWGADGRPDGFSSLGSLLGTYPIIIGVMAGFLLLTARVVHQERAMAGLVAGTAVFEGVLFYGLTWLQRGLTNTTQVSVTGPQFVGAASGLLVGALVAWWLREPGVPRAAGTPLPAGASTLPVGGSTTIAWTGRTRLGRAAPWLVVFGLLPLVVLTVWLGWLGNLGAAGFLALTLGAVALLMTSLHSRVTIDHRGVQARSLGLIRWTNIPLATIEGATVKPEVWPLGDFGGYGVRGGFDGSMGLVTAHGPALVVERAERRPYYLTVEDADTAAATLNTLVARSRPH